MQATHTVGHRVYTPGSPDAHGNAVDAWAVAVDLDVYAIAPRTSVEPVEGRLGVVIGKALLAPFGTAVGPLDLVVIDGEDYEVEGEVADYNRGPFGFRPGVVIALKRAEG